LYQTINWIIRFLLITTGLALMYIGFKNRPVNDPGSLRSGILIIVSAVAVFIVMFLIYANYVFQ
jgi:multisubunit Na+/H+ antiporter MnhB subunit